MIAIVIMQDLAHIMTMQGMGKSPVLDQYGIKFSPDTLLWTISTSKAVLDGAIEKLIPLSWVAKSKTLFLEHEIGSKSAGLTHIWQRHGGDFKKLLNINSADQKYLYKIMSQGEYYIWAYNLTHRGGLEIVYIINENLYLHVAIGSNGFIVTAFPSRNNMSHYGKPRYKY